MRKFLLFGLFLFFPFFVNAATSLKASSQNPVVGSYIYVELNIDYGRTVKIGEAHYVISYDDANFVLENVIWTQSAGTYRKDGGNIYIDKPNNGSPWEYGGQVQLKLKVLKSGVTKVNVRENGLAKYIDGSVVSQTYSGITISAVEANTDTTIGSLFVEGYSISPTFSKTTYDYNLNVPESVSSINVVARKGDSRQVITGDGVRNLNYGANRIRVVVIAESGASRTYEIMVNREDNRTGDTSLKKLTVSNTDIEYNAKYDSYTAVVSRSVESVLITATTNDANASLLGTGVKNLEIGTNTFTLKVSSSNGAEKVYTINIVRSEEELQINEASGDILSLKINGEVIDAYNKDVYLYGVSNEEKLDISVVLKSKTASYDVLDYDLQSGISVVGIKVVDEGIEHIYKVLVYKPGVNVSVFKDFSLIPNAKVVEYNSGEQEFHQLSEREIDAIKAIKRTFNYNVVNAYKGLLYQLRFDSEVLNKDLDFSVLRESNYPLTLSTSLPSGVEMMYYVGDCYPDGAVLKLYSYNEIGDYTFITEGMSVVDGYVTFSTNGQNYYVITPVSLVHKNGFLEFVKKYILIIICGVLLLFVGIYFYLKKKGKFPKVKRIKSDEPQY